MMHTLASSKVICFPQERNIQLSHLFEKASRTATANLNACDSSRSKRRFFCRNFTSRVNNHRFKDTYYLPILPSYLAPQPGGKGWFCHGWNCVQAFAIFVFTSDKNNAIVTSCDSTSNIPYNAREATPTNHLWRQNKVHKKGLIMSVLKCSPVK